ncbi:acyltransferase family protein [Oceanospirillum beijerinckii]|uniref:acyltransferase family protein n=1 Tax=Oceanospirillum beijerinckii TaxID=64976 RepID=UPI000417FB3B|nr:acyltransferase [Oceanospirillum beijerinckii]
MRKSYQYITGNSIMKLNSYRLDIDGLRALAVLLVLGFHLNLELISGGHIGVDAFFVLSGFLITSILVEQISQNQFSIRQFYLRRIQRLFPALYTTVLLTFIAAAFILLPNNFEQFARSAIAAIFSLSNVLFWAESGYWDIASESKPLLHTWSLGVEEQFYLVWPVLLLVLIRLKLPVLRILTAITALGFLLSYFYSQFDLSGAFYLLPARVFQFSAGGGVSNDPCDIFSASSQIRSTEKHSLYLRGHNTAGQRLGIE